MLSYIYSFDTDIGLVRKRNEDYSYATVNRHGDILLTLLDGMGGHVNGQLASRTTLNLLLNEFNADIPLVGLVLAESLYHSTPLSVRTSSSL